MMHKSIVAGPIALALMISPAFANTITFETPSTGTFTGPVTESGFTYSTLSGSGGLYVNVFGNPGNDMEGLQSMNGGTLSVVSASGGDFIFNAVDFAANSFDGTGSQTLVVLGFLGGSLVGIDSYTRLNDSTYGTETASVLAGQSLSELEIILNGGTSPQTYVERIDNLVLTPTPLPAALPLFASGLGALGLLGWRRKRKKAAAMAAA